MIDAEPPMTRSERLTTLLMWVVSLLLIGLVTTGLYNAAWGAEPTSCSFPTSADDFQAVANLDRWTSAHHNQLLCAVNRLQDRTLAEGQTETVCTTANIGPSTRQLVNLALATTVTASAPTFATVLDTLNPSRLVVDGIQGVSGTTVSVWLFNHDAGATRSGKVCATVVR